MDRFFIIPALCALLALAPLHGEEYPEAQPVFFSLLFPQLAPQEEAPAWLLKWLGHPAGEAVAL